MNLSTYVEEISDDFQSTFAVLNENTLSNLLSKSDFDNLTEIIKKHCPTLEVEFIKVNELDDSDYSIYLIKEMP